MIEVRGLVAGYGKRDVVAVPSLTIPTGTVTALIGPNGAGKSTLLRCLAGILRPHAGTVTLGARNVHHTRAREMAHDLAFVGQETEAQFAFTVRELVQMGTDAHPASMADIGPNRVAHALEAMDLGALADRSLLRLSAGERQRAAIARALAQETPWLMLDEPTAHLDLRHQAALMNLLRSRARERGTGTIIVLHDLNIAGAWADRLILLSEGTIVADGIPRTVLTRKMIEKVYQTPIAGASESEYMWVHVAPEDK